MKIRVFLTLLPILFLVVGVLMADSEPKTDRDVKDRPEYINDLYAKIPETRPSPIMSLEGQQYMQRLPAVGREDLHAKVDDWPMVAEECATSTQNDDVFETIRRLAADTRVVIINEAHDRPRHRDFIRRLAIELQPLGYNHFAAEAFRFSNPLETQFSYAKTDYGTYVNEPVFGGLVRSLIELNVNIFSYEVTETEESSKLGMRERVEFREEGQALALSTVIANLNEGERILIHVGYAHAAEVPIQGFGGAELSWMATRLKENTGINPLTIDQTDCVSPSDIEQFTGLSRKHIENQYDLVIGHPPLSFKNSRPEWRSDHQVVEVEIPEKLRTFNRRTIVEARYANEPMEAVPVDRVMLWKGETVPLLLPRGSYVITSFPEEETTSRNITLDVEF